MYDYHIFEETVKKNEKSVIQMSEKKLIEKTMFEDKPFVDVRDNIYNDIYELFCDNGFSLDKGSILTTQDTIPTHFDKKTFDFYYYMNIGNHFMKPLDKFHNIINSLGYTESYITDNIFYPITNSKMLSLNLPKFRTISINPLIEGLSLYLETTPEVREYEWKNLVELTNNDYDYHNGLLNSIFGDEDKGYILKNKMLGIGFGFNGTSIMNELKYFFIYNNLNEDEKNNLNSIISNSPDVIKNEHSIIGDIYIVGLTISNNSVDYYKYYYR
jgi:hypothetical protein